MSLRGPSTRPAWQRWALALWPAALAVGATYSAWPWLTSGHWPSLAGIAVVLALAVGLTLGEIRRACLSGPITAPGFVSVVERRIRFFGPTIGPLPGGVMDVAEIERIELDVDPSPIPDTMDTDVTWRLIGGGRVLEIPAHAAGAEQLYDAFAPLAGIDWDAVAAVMSEPYMARYTVWEKQG
ncbi:MAG: hypothetical protein AAFR46_08425 [Pseudomonadota bacterium]